MAGADEGGLRVGPYVPESGLEPTDGSTDNAVTEIIPAVGDGTSAPAEAPKVRAVARRSAVALPTLGGPDTTPKVPRSSRSTLDRRQRARERERAAGGDPKSSTATSDAPSPDPGAPSATAPSATAPSETAPSATSATSLDTASASAAEGERPPRPPPVNPFAARPPRPRRSPEQMRPAGDDEWPAADAWPEVRPAPDVPLPSQPAPPPPSAPAPVPVPPPARLRRTDDTAEIEAVPVPALAERGPISPDSDGDDRWDDEPSGALGSDAYQGRRRARRRATRPLVVAGLVALLVGALIVVPLVLRSTPTGGPPAVADPGTRPAVVIPVPTTDDDGEISSTAGAGASATPTPRPPARTTTTRAAPVAPVDPPVTTAAAPTTAPVFQTLTIEGESGAVAAPAERSSNSAASGGQLVGFLGITQGRSGQGRLTLNVSVPTAGTYTVTFHYIASSARTAHIIVNGNPAITVAVPERDNCCGTGSLNVTLQAGTNTIEFTNPTARCPAIDRVVITRP